MSGKNIDSEIRELIDAFIAESNDLLDDVESKLNHFTDDDNCEGQNTVFRAFHSIKGTAGYLNFKNITSITHTAETLLDIFRKESICPASVEVDVLYLTCDILRKLLLNIEKELDDNAFGDDVKIIVESIQKLIENHTKQPEKKIIKEEKKTHKENKNQSDDLVTEEIIEKFASESSSLLEKTEEDILKLEKDPDNQELVSSIFRNIHTIKGNAGFIGNEKIEKECRETESFLEKIRSKEKQVSNSAVTYILSQIDLINKMLDSLSGKTVKNEELVEEYKPLGEILVEMGAISNDILDKALDVQQSKIGEILIDKGMVSEEVIREALEKQSKNNADQSIDSSLIAKRSDVRVSTLKLDKLFELAGEIVTAQAMVVNSPDLDGLDLQRFEKAANYLVKITREMQETAMTIRMIPMDGIFNKTIRLVRDLSRKANKKIEIRISGEDTEMDRKIIEELSDPLVHLIRNSIDHGIEEKEERVKSGKSETSLIKLDAKYEGNEIWITISDDGRGLDREKILQKAKERNLLTVDPETLSNDDVWQFIFMPGFSTAEKITDISGRGVGMDVVKKNIEKVKGKVAVRSVRGHGTDMILKIPLTVAILDVITVKVAENVYSIPTIDILEFLQAKEEQITLIEGKKEILKIRNDIVPVIKLFDFYKINTDITKLTEGVMVVVQREKKKAALFIDTILGSQQVVIKPLSDKLKDARGISGCSILGNGDLSLIIDTGRLIEETLG